MLKSEHISPFAISGKIRKEKKKELSKLKLFVRDSWRHEDVDRVLGGGMSDNVCNKIITDTKEKILQLEIELNEPSISVNRDNKLNEIGI